jgi:hypothetical protein
MYLLDLCTLVDRWLHTRNWRGLDRQRRRIVASEKLELYIGVLCLLPFYGVYLIGGDGDGALRGVNERVETGSLPGNGRDGQREAQES